MIVVPNYYLLLQTLEAVEELTDSRPKVRNSQGVADNIAVHQSKEFPQDR